MRAVRKRAGSAQVVRIASRGRALGVARLLSILATSCAIAAIVVQDHTDYLPLGVFNTGSKSLSRLSDLCLGLAIVALIAQLIEWFSGRLRKACGALRGCYVFVLILNVLLVFGDRLFVTGNPAGLLGQYYEVASSGREPVILKKDFSGAIPHPCLTAVAPTDGPRVLFLGDSYTEGSGRARACNYTDVAEATLRERANPRARVINGGVSGYGPVEALHLLRWQRARGCPIDAVVFNLVLENDFADNLPKTERRVVAGIITRFPRSWFLRTFHPLNMRTFRWALVLTFFARASTKEMLQAVVVEEGPCDLSPRALAEVSPLLRSMMERSFANAERVAAAPKGREEAARAIREMRDIARELGVPFVLVLFPDRALIDAELQRLMGIDLDRIAPSEANRAFARQSLSADAVLDVSEALGDGAGMYRAVDAHLSDLGNVVAGRYVGQALAEHLRE